MDLGIVIIIIMAILLIFHLVFFKLTQDDTNQFIIYGIFVCYSFCILLEKNATNISLFNKMPDLISYLMISVSLILGVQYVSNLLDNGIFRRIALAIQAADIFIFIVGAVLFFVRPGAEFFFTAMFVLCLISLTVYAVSLILCWCDLPSWYQTLLCAMLFMVFCFTMLLLFDALHIRYAYYWAIGFIVYVVVYEVFSIWKVIEDISLFRRMSQSAEKPQPTESEINDTTKIKWTHAEEKILAVMGEGETESKGIAVKLSKRPATIDTQIRTMLKKSGLSSRIDLAKLYGIKQQTNHF